MKRVITVLTAIALVAVAGNARATTVNILDEFGNEQDNLDVFFRVQGFTATNISASFTAADLAGAKLTIISLPSAVPSASQLAALSSYVQGGGRLLLNSEHSLLFSPQIGNVNAILSALGSSISNQLTDFDSGPHMTTTILSDPFTEGVHSIFYAATSSLTGGIELVAGVSCQDFIARQGLGSGQLFVIADTNTADGLSGSSVDCFDCVDNARLYLNFLGATPEPSTLVLLGSSLTGLIGSMAWRRHRR